MGVKTVIIWDELGSIRETYLHHDEIERLLPTMECRAEVMKNRGVENFYRLSVDPAQARRSRRSSYRAACAAHPRLNPPVVVGAFLKSQGWRLRVRGRRAGRSPLCLALRTLISCSSDRVLASAEKISENCLPLIWVWIEMQELRYFKDFSRDFRT